MRQAWTSVKYYTDVHAPSKHGRRWANVVNISWRPRPDDVVAMTTASAAVIEQQQSELWSVKRNAVIFLLPCIGYCRWHPRWPIRLLQHLLDLTDRTAFDDGVWIGCITQVNYCSCDGVVVRASDLRGRKLRVTAAPLHVTTLGKLFTHMCPCSPSSINWYRRN